MWEMLGAQNYQNPFSGIDVDASTAQAQQGSQAYGSSIAQDQTSLAGMQNQSNSYPTFANAYGVGSQQPFGTPASSTDKSALTANPSAANRGFNPWSLVGEANAR